MKHKFKKAAAFVLAMVISAGAVPFRPVSDLIIAPLTVNAATGNSIDYVDANGTAQDPVDCTVVSSEGLSGGHVFEEGWYAVTDDVTISAGMIVWRNTNLILCDGATLTANDGIWVQSGATFTIWAQSDGENMGKIVTTGGESKAGIGGIKDENCGTVIINGGHIEEVAKAVSEAGATIYNIIPLIAQYELKDAREPSCIEIDGARTRAGQYIDVFRHCQRCRADAVGIPGKLEIGDRIYQRRLEPENTFSHG